MTDFATLQAGTATSRPVELFEFVGKPTVYRYTSAEDEIVVDGRTFVPTAVSRKGIARSADSRLGLTQITLPADDPIVALHTPKPSPFQVTAKILRIERDEAPTPVARTIFVGFLKTMTFDDNGHVATFGAISVDAFLARTLPRFTYQSVCNHQLYDGACQANPAGHTFTGICTAQDESPSGTRITVPGVSASGFFFRGGLAAIQGTTDPRMVIQQGSVLTSDQDDLVILKSFNDDPVGQTIEIVEGCDHLINGDCGAKFDVVQNFGGFAWVPFKNLFVTGLY